MNPRNICLTIVVLLILSAIPMGAQEKLGDLVSQDGFEWIIGKWATTTDGGDKIEFEYKWELDKNIILMDLKMGDFKYHSMTMFRPSSEEVIQIGADNKGGTWKGIWQNEYGDAIHRTEHTSREGEVTKADIVHRKVDADTLKVAMYGIEPDGSRAASPWTELTYKRQKKPRISATVEAVGKPK